MGRWNNQLRDRKLLYLWGHSFGTMRVLHFVVGSDAELSFSHSSPELLDGYGLSHLDLRCEHRHRKMR
jgi:hypothetical protein